MTVLTDRGFGDTKLYDFMKQELGFDFVIRFRGNIKVTDARDETRMIGLVQMAEQKHFAKRK